MTIIHLINVFTKTCFFNETLLFQAATTNDDLKTMKVSERIRR